MDAELLELQRQFESAQQAKSSVRLSERNVVELILKLQELRFIDFELLHTVSGKEYITTEQLQFEMVAEIRKSGRVSLIDMSDILGVDLYHIEKQGQLVAASDPGLMLVNGEIISESYWDGVAEEINEKLQECSHIFLAEIAAQLNVGSEFVMSVLEPRLGTIVLLVDLVMYAQLWEEPLGSIGKNLKRKQSSIMQHSVPSMIYNHVLSIQV